MESIRLTIGHYLSRLVNLKGRLQIKPLWFTARIGFGRLILAIPGVLSEVV